MQLHVYSPHRMSRHCHHHCGSALLMWTAQRATSAEKLLPAVHQRWVQGHPCLAMAAPKVQSSERKGWEPLQPALRSPGDIGAGVDVGVGVPWAAAGPDVPLWAEEVETAC